MVHIGKRSKDCVERLGGDWVTNKLQYKTIRAEDSIQLVKHTHTKHKLTHTNTHTHKHELLEIYFGSSWPLKVKDIRNGSSGTSKFVLT